jgi:phosphate transport system substrate-binding protein
VQRVEVGPLETGVVVGGAYRIVRPIAEGGVGPIYEAEQIATGERRALEVVRGPFRSHDGLRARFVRETRLAASIPNEHVVQVLDAGQDRATGALYVVMELLDGSTVSSALRSRGPFRWESALAILGEVADALRAAHARDIVHRDLKPESVFLAQWPEGTRGRAALPFKVKVFDFGIAKALSSGGEGAPATLLAPAWMAPELGAFAGSGDPIGPHTDVWGFGLLAFTLVTGRRYFASGNVESSLPGEGLREIAFGDLPAASERAAHFGIVDRLSPDFDAWFARCVHRDPRDRFDAIGIAFEALAGLPPPTPSEVAPFDLVTERDLERAAGVPSSRALATVNLSAPPRIRPRGWGPAIVVLGGFVGLVMAALLLWRTHAREAMPAAAAAYGQAPIALRLHGSNTIGTELAPALAQAFLQRRTGAKWIAVRHTAPDEVLVEARDGDGAIEAIEIAAHGSATAFADLGAGLCDVGMSSRRIHDEEAAKLAALGEMGSAASEHVIALDGIAVIVNPANPVFSLTKTQVADVFSGRARRWSDVGGKNEPIVVHARDDKSGTYDSFKHMVLAGGALIADAQRHESSEKLSDAVAADEDAVGFIGLPYVRSAKPVMVKEEGSPPLLPSPMTVSTEDYPLTRRLYLYLPLGASLAARDFVDFAQSEEGQKVVEAAGFVDLRPECDPTASHCASCTAAYRELLAGACRLSTDFRFDRGSARLDTRALRDLQRIAALMARSEYRSKSIVLLGFSDANGTRDDNLLLSRQRASGVAAQLRARGLRVDVERGFGADMPVSENATEDGRERNRRVEAWLH